LFGYTYCSCLFVQTPFGLTADASGQKLYVSDWDKKAIFEVDVSSNTATMTQVVSDVALPMAVQYSAVSGGRGMLCCLKCLRVRLVYSQQCYFNIVCRYNITTTTIAVAISSTFDFYPTGHFYRATLCVARSL